MNSDKILSIFLYKNILKSIIVTIYYRMFEIDLNQMHF
jgi:hypothetical protein